MRGHNSWVAIIWVICPWILQAQSVDADRVLILANENVPESMLLAEFYREQRGIAREQVLHVDIIAEESIDYRAFVDGIWNPIREYLTSTKLVKGRTEINEEEYGRNLLRIDESQLKYIVICKGIPLKINRGLEVLQFSHDEIPQAFRTVQASVDSELALILNNRTDPIGILKNPNFDPPLSHLVDYRYSVAVGRIEGPSYAISRRMILDGIETERNGGLVGRAYVDLHSQHPLGNQWFMNAADSIDQFGLDIDIESTDRHWSLSDRHDAPAIYLGWYSGNANGPAVSNQVDVPQVRSHGTYIAYLLIL